MNKSPLRVFSRLQNSAMINKTENSNRMLRQAFWKDCRFLLEFIRCAL